MVHGSQAGYYVHQQAVYDVLHDKEVPHIRGILGYARGFERAELDDLAFFAGEDADRKEWQDVEDAWRHAMTPWSEQDQKRWKGDLAAAKAHWRATANDRVKRWLETASRSYEAHLRSYKAGAHKDATNSRREALKHLGYAIHCLQDATSKAHADFRQFTDDSEYVDVKWTDWTYSPGVGLHPKVELNEEMLAHVEEEFGYPLSTNRHHSWINQATYRGYYYFYYPKQITAGLDLFAGLGFDDNDRDPYSKAPRVDTTRGSHREGTAHKVPKYGLERIPKGYRYPTK